MLIKTFYKNIGRFNIERTRYMKNKMIEYLKMYVRRKQMKVNREKLIENINRNWTSKNCPMCGKNDWIIDANIMTMVSVEEDKSISLGGNMKILPVIAVTCKQCGNTIFL